jgi:8-oxo-dGTP pyrophosphatase MutT (NUDIX family)
MRETGAAMVSETKHGKDGREIGPPWRAHIEQRLNRNPAELDLRESLKPAAVLVPIVERAEPTVLLTKRSEKMPTHAGQISFPGGRVHVGDATLVATALRELEEEIGIGADFVSLGGFLDPYETVNSGFMILPVVGFVRNGFTLEVNAHEVAEVFEAPLAFLIDPKNRARVSVEREGVMREFHTIAFGEHTIWGATAEMIVNLGERLRA